MQWEDLTRLPWGVLVLFGGGLALAAQVSSSGLAVWLGESLVPLTSMGMLVLVVAAAGLVVFLTELTSNLATTATLTRDAAMAASSGIDPLVLCVPELWRRVVLLCCRWQHRPTRLFSRQGF